jgi:beta-lactamase regulating signal transducer with metallopeptidase domain
MLGWSAQTTVIAMILAAIAILASRSTRLGPAARHVLWLVVLIKLLTPPVVNWPWSPPKLWATAEPAAVTSQAINVQNITQSQVATAPKVITPPQITALQDWQGKSQEPARATVALPAPRIGWTFDALRQGLFALWLGISAAIALWQIGRIVRFHRRLSWVIPAPEWLVEEVRNLSRQLGVRPPEILVLPDLAPPMLWFLGRAKLILPGRLVSHADPLGLRAILAHELAHLHRGDHWVRRLDFFAGLIWWWNPVYWLTRERLGTEAELACDEWAIQTVPDGRVSYAEALLDVCRTLSTTKSPAPALGVAGAGRFLERRVNMILQNHAPSRISVPVLLGAGLLALLALPGWSAAGSVPPKSSDQATSASKEGEHLLASATDAKADVVVADDYDDKDADAVKDQVAKELKKALGPGSDFEKEMKNLGVELTKELGPGSDFEKAMKTLGVELNKELGPGSDFEKEMKNLGAELGKQFGPGSDFEKQMKTKGKAIDGKFGPGSDFEKRMQAKGKEIEAKFGPGSDFEQRMERFGKEMEAKFGEGSEFAEKMKQATNDAKAAKESSDTPSDKKKTTAKKKTTSKAHAVKALKAQIDELNAQLKKLQEADDEND